MPTYEYACRSCGEHLEVVQSFREDALTTCPNCEGELRKVFSAAGIIFKGSGWHIKDYADKKGGAATPAAASGKDGASAGEGSSSDSSSSTTPSGDKAAGEKTSGDKAADKGSSKSTGKGEGGTSSSAESA